MKKIIAVTMALLVIFLFTQCHSHHHRRLNTYFWTSSADAEHERVYINGELVGELPFLEETPDEENGLKEEALLIQLRSGKYKIVIRDEEGEIKFRETLKLHIKDNGKSVTASTNGEGYRSFRIINEEDMIEEILDN